MKRPNAWVVLVLVLVCTSTALRGETKAYPNSPAGLQQQFMEIVSAGQQHDGPRVEALIQNFALPKIDEWAAANLPQSHRSSFVEKYNLALKVFEATLLGQVDRVSGLVNSSVTVVDAVLPAGIPDDSRELMRLAGAAPYRVQFAGGELQPDKMIETFLYYQGSFRFAGQGIFPFWVPPPRGFRAEGTVPRILYSPDPSYPEEARKKRIQGSVTIGLTVGTDGVPRDLVVKGGNPALIGAALEAVRRWKFIPAEVDGKAVEYPLTVSVNFTLFSNR